ncbi:MAG: hypothetical protein ACK5OC_06945 [Pirellula sp.]
MISQGDRDPIHPSCGSDNRRKVEEYFASIRVIEQRIALFSTPVKPMNNLFSTMLEHVGMESIVFGDGTGKVQLA